MNIVLIRHADAGERDATKWPDDALRPLTPEGRRRHAQVSRAMREMGIRFEFLFSSPLIRALQTAEVVADIYAFGQATKVSEALGPACTGTKVVQLVAKLPPDARVALVGHEPSFSRTAAELIGAPEARIELKKSGAIGIAFEGAPAVGGGTLRYVLRPGQLRRVLKGGKH
jgi:phosphohistidine phosphatase